MIGVWDAETYNRIFELPSGGIGPHEIIRTDSGFAVANGGIQTHPDTGRSKLNLPSMQPNLSYLDAQGHIEDQVELPPEHRLNSIRHIAFANGRVALGMQWQGDDLAPTLVAFHSQREGLVFEPSGANRTLQGYTGSVAISPDGAQIATTHPRGKRIQFWDTNGESRLETAVDVGGIAQASGGFLATAGTGAIRLPDGTSVQRSLNWDNHLVPLFLSSSI